jgi:hypothetical protein
VILGFTFLRGVEVESAGLGPTLEGVPASASYEPAPGVGGWFSADRVHFGLTGEVGFTATGSRTSAVTYVTLLPRIDGLVEYVVRPHGTALRLGAGPALTLRLASIRTDDWGLTNVRLDPGLRLRFALQGPIAGPVGFGFWVAGTAGVTLAYDAGLGIAWRAR